MAFDLNTQPPTLSEGAPPQNNNAQPPNLDNGSPGSTGSTIFDSGQSTVYKYNQADHEVEIYLDNTGDFDKMKTDPKRFFLNPSAILGLNISETAMNWTTTGTLAFMYLPEGAPDIAAGGQNKSTPTKGAIDNGKTLKSYQFRGDGFDLLRIRITPKSAPTDAASADSTIKINNEPKWTLSYVFSIYDVEDVNDIPALKGPAASYMKCLKLYFHDVRYQMLKTTNLEYSTATNSDEPQTRAMYTGKALAEILNAALSDPENGGCEEFKIDDTIPDKWNIGASKLFYTSPAAASALDDVNYLYSHHVSDKNLKTTDLELSLNDLCLLQTKRAEESKLIQYLSLTSLSDIFAKAGKEASSPGELQKEHFIVTGHTEQDEKGVTKLHRAPIGGDNETVDVKTYKYGQIISYSFVDMSPQFNSSNFNTTPVYSVDIGNRVFNIQFKGNEVKTARNAIAETYISELYKKKESTNDDLFLGTIHKTKKNVNIFPTFSLNGDDTPEGSILRQKNTLHQLLYSGLFENTCVCFKVLGLTLREAGSFIGIDRTEGCENNDYNNKLFGQWFVVKVDHIFEAGAYMNIIYAVKIHRFDTLVDTFAATIDE